MSQPFDHRIQDLEDRRAVEGNANLNDRLALVERFIRGEFPTTSQPYLEGPTDDIGASAAEAPAPPAVSGRTYQVIYKGANGLKETTHITATDVDCGGDYCVLEDLDGPILIFPRSSLISIARVEVDPKAN